MKYIKMITIIIFSAMLILPVTTFDFTPEAVSEIDNRELAENPLVNPGDDLTTSIEDYVNDRIGFRNEMIQAYTLLNDRIFGKMVHPSYTYGKDGYVFGAGIEVYTRYNEFHEAFADMVKELQDYCEARDVPFLFVFDPAKPAVLQEYIADGINYNREWVDLFFEALDERGVHYLDNTETLLAAKESGEQVFNVKFDANHWNNLGAYYGTNAIAEALHDTLPGIHVNTESDVTFGEIEQTSLLVSKFPINEMVPTAEFYTDSVDITERYAGELELDENYRDFGYFINPDREEEGGAKALVFQGSYMNEYGQYFLRNVFGEYIYVHDYQNVLNFPYYYNLFKPECVVFEVAEYTFTDTYFSFERMEDFKLQESYYTIDPSNVEFIPLADAVGISVNEGDTLTKIDWETEDVFQNAWLVFDDIEYDLQKTDTGYTVTILTKEYNRYGQMMELAVE